MAAPYRALFAVWEPHSGGAGDAGPEQGGGVPHRPDHTDGRVLPVGCVPKVNSLDLQTYYCADCFS